MYFVEPSLPFVVAVADFWVDVEKVLVVYPYYAAADVEKVPVVYPYYAVADAENCDEV